MEGSVGPPSVFRGLRCWVAVFLTLGCAAKSIAQVEGSAGDGGTKPFTATVALREGYDSNPLTQSYQTQQDVQSSTYTQITPSLGYNYVGLQADAALRYDFSGTYYPSINQAYDIQYQQTLTGRYTYQIDPRVSITLGDNFLYTEQPLVAQFVQAGIAPTFNTSTINNLATVEANFLATERLNLVTRWNNSLVYLGGNQGNSNYMNNGAFQQFGLTVTPETTATFTFEYQIYDYDNDNAYRDNQQATFSVGARQEFRPPFDIGGTPFLDGRIGIQLNDNYGLADSDVIVGNGGLGSGEQEIGANPFAAISSTWGYDDNSSSFVKAGFSMQVQQSNLNTAADSQAYSVDLSWDHYFTEKFSVIQSFFMNVAVFTPQLSQQQTTSLGLPYQGSGQQTTVTYNCKFAYQFTPYLSAELGWAYVSYGNYFDLNNGNGGSYTRNQVYVGLRGTY